MGEPTGGPGGNQDGAGQAGRLAKVGTLTLGIGIGILSQLVLPVSAFVLDHVFPFLGWKASAHADLQQLYRTAEGAKWQVEAAQDPSCSQAFFRFRKIEGGLGFVRVRYRSSGAAHEEPTKSDVFISNGEVLRENTYTYFDNKGNARKFDFYMIGEILHLDEEGPPNEAYSKCKRG